MTLEEAKKMDIQSIIVGVFVLLSALAAVLGFGMLSIGILMVLAFCYVMAGMGKDRGRHVFPLLYRIDGLSAHLHHLGQLLLGDAQNGPFNTDIVCHN